MYSFLKHNLQSLSGIRRQDTVAIFVNKTYVGNYLEFREYLTTKYNFSIDVWSLNYEQLVYIGVQNYYRNEKVKIRIIAINIW